MFLSLTSKIERSLWSPEAESVASHHVKLAESRNISKVNHISEQSPRQHIVLFEALAIKHSLSAFEHNPTWQPVFALVSKQVSLIFGARLQHR